MTEEYKSLTEMQTWTLTTPPPNRKPVTCKWTYKIKRNQKGEIIRFKARLVARGFSQIQGLDYTDTSAPVARASTIRLFLAVAHHFDLILASSDISTAYLNGKLTDTIYMEQPPLFENENRALVCRLNRAIYGLKQSGLVWFECINKWLKENGWNPSETDRCLFTKRNENRVIFLILYVDDIAIASNNQEAVENFRAALGQRFKVKHDETFSGILGLHVQQDKEQGTLTISQQRFIEDTLKRFGMDDCNPVSTPCDTTLRLSKDMCAKTAADYASMKTKPYRALVGSLLYIATQTRPDILFATINVARYCEHPGPKHWGAAKRILRYLAGTKTLGLVFHRPQQEGPPNVVGYVDSDHAGDTDERRSVTGCVFAINGTAVHWISRYQKTIALSSAESEFVAASIAAQESRCLKQLLQAFWIDHRTTVLYQDNKSAIHMATNDTGRRTKHIDTRYKYVIEAVKNKDIDIRYVKSSDNQADILTKGLTKGPHQKLRDCILGTNQLGEEC